MSKYQTGKVAQRRRKVFIILTSLFSAFLFLLVGLLAFVSRMDFIIIKEIAVSGNHSVDKEKIIKSVQENISGNYFFLFSKKNSLIYPKDKIEKTLLEKFPRIESVSVESDFSNNLSIKVKEREPFVLWCSDENCFVSDKNGLIFDKFDGSLEESFFKYYTKISDPINKNIFKKNYFNDIHSFVELVKGEGLDPFKLLEVDSDTYEIYFSGNSRLIFKPSRDIKETMNNFQSILNMEEFEDREVIKGLEYVDLRYGNKVFYK